MSKCGGLFINDLLKEMSPGFPTLIGEEMGLTEERHRNVFVIASTRNPCDYYVSLWSFQHDRTFTGAQNKEYGFFDLEDPNHRNATKFREWLAWVQGPKFSVMSSRFWETLVAKKEGLSCWEDNFGSCTESLDVVKVNTDLSQFKPSEVADCWVYTENLMGDLGDCLVKYEQQSGRKLDWEPFHRISEKVNPSERDTCEHYYTPEAEASVRRQDAWMFEAFGYTTCCGSATQPMK